MSDFNLLEHRVLQSLQLYELYSGHTHPAEVLMQQIVGMYTEERLLAFIFEPEGREQPYYTARLVGLAGRADGVSETLQLEVLSRGLVSANIEVRDNAIQATEGWENPAAIPLLQAFRDPDGEAWLDRYAAQVAVDLQECE